MVAILGSVAIALAVNERVAQRGLPGVLPTRMLLWLMPLAGERSSTNGGIMGELHQRASNSNSFTQDHWIAYIDRMARGDFRARPTTDQWIRKYGDVVTYWRQQFINDRSLEPLLLNIPPRLDVHARPSWPVDTPMTVTVGLRDWWPWGMECRVRATPRFGNGLKGPTTTFVRTGDDRFQRTAYALDLPPTADPDAQVTIDFEIERRRMAGVAQTARFDPDATPEQWQPVARHSVTLPTRFQGSTADAIKPVQTEAMNRMIAQVFQFGATKWQTGDSPVRFHINMQGTFGPDFDDTAIGIRAELVQDETVARRLNLWWIAGSKALSYADRDYGFEVDFEDAELLKQVNADDGRWAIRITGDPAIALRAGSAPRYWNGEVTIPLNLQRSNGGTAPPRPWWTEEAIDH